MGEASHPGPHRFASTSEDDHEVLLDSLPPSRRRVRRRIRDNDNEDALIGNGQPTEPRTRRLVLVSSTQVDRVPPTVPDSVARPHRRRRVRSEGSELGGAIHHDLTLIDSSDDDTPFTVPSSAATRARPVLVPGSGEATWSRANRFAPLSEEIEDGPSVGGRLLAATDTRQTEHDLTRHDSDTESVDAVSGHNDVDARSDAPQRFSGLERRPGRFLATVFARRDATRKRCLCWYGQFG